MANRATRCPHCQTSFRVTESQLATARGRVRCGACLEVFNATTNWVDPAPSQPDIPEPEPRYDDNTPFPEDDAGQESASIEDTEAQTHPQNDTAAQPTENEAEPDQEEMAQSEDEAEDHTSDGYRFSALDSDSDDEEAARFSDPCEESEDSSDTSVQWADRTEQEDIAESEEVSAPPPEEEEIGTSEEQPQAESPIQEIEPSEPDRDVEHDEFDELVAHQRRRIQISRRHVGWTLLCLLAAACLAGQIVYAKFNSLAQSQHRNALVETCKVINWAWGSQRCVLPPPRNLSQIDSLGLNIMSHPRYADSLLVDTIILNRARFEQPFPLIELIFRNDRGNIVARRAFSPHEYLAGELKGIEFMPSGQSVRINISIADPGSTAVNYEMQFLPAAES
ncbi:putative Zn finger-like uncharacterized protein [Litorivivens lipolytica]|uniref:Putative Zn finger-like uncharacterized protein n=1 Tax=Litorivivens lipolytica TaxID=1524264 RepID=A0A7W4Z7Q5_9GAMM|nr:DUF3426 domain-containing protein [Litorivivens lipolytica]MBB3048151.1 putative Zn finger-like uncharacterized protein [Litorivivens lipolytica]